MVRVKRIGEPEGGKMIDLTAITVATIISGAVGGIIMRISSAKFKRFELICEAHGIKIKKLEKDSEQYLVAITGMMRDIAHTAEAIVDIKSAVHEINKKISDTAAVARNVEEIKELLRKRQD
jgi:hypothetical protein